MEYLKNVPENFQWQQTPLQIYPLSIMRNHFKLPLPALKTDYNFLFYIREGSFVNKIGDEIYRGEKDSLIFVSVGAVSALQEISSGLRGYFILMEQETISLLFNQQELLNVFTIDPVLKLKRVESDWIHSVCRLIYADLTPEKPNVQIASNLIQALLNKILLLSEKKRTISRTEHIAIGFKQMVHQQFINHKEISFYADSLAVSSNYLNRCVKAVFHKSCKEIIIEVAILNAQILLADNTKTISEISHELNFHDPSYFARLFKNFTDFTPSEYRLKVLHDLS